MGAGVGNDKVDVGLFEAQFPLHVASGNVELFGEVEAYFFQTAVVSFLVIGVSAFAFYAVAVHDIILCAIDAEESGGIDFLAVVYG